jgi:hypothetical protein
MSDNSDSMYPFPSISTQIHLTGTNMTEAVPRRTERASLSEDICSEWQADHFENAQISGMPLEYRNEVRYYNMTITSTHTLGITQLDNRCHSCTAQGSSPTSPPHLPKRPYLHIKLAGVVCMITLVGFIYLKCATPATTIPSKAPALILTSKTTATQEHPIMTSLRKSSAHPQCMTPKRYYGNGLPVPG